MRFPHKQALFVREGTQVRLLRDQALPKGGRSHVGGAPFVGLLPATAYAAVPAQGAPLLGMTTYQLMVA